MAVIAVALHAIAAGPEAARAALRVEPLTIAGIGLLCAVAAGFWGIAAGGDFLTGVWPLLTTTPEGDKAGLPVGSVLLFDTGVYLTVLGAVSAILFALEDAVYAEGDD
jgi:multicomponent Na+:H+ antiporter subunit B